MNNSEKIWELIHLTYIDGIGPKKLQYLIKFSKNIESVWQIPTGQISKILGPSLVTPFLEARNSFNSDQIKRKIESTQVEVITVDDLRYPVLLREITDYPPILYAKGDLDLLNDQQVKLAVVGSRKYSQYGRIVNEALVPGFVQANLAIVSGLALGIDSLAHQETLKNFGKTIAILGCGLDFIYPAENKNLVDRILESGSLIVSEFPPGIPPLKQHFPRRNRIIAGISQGVLVIEAARDSGSLITASLALDYNRDVFAVPGEINKVQSEGTNWLIKQGANLITAATDVLDIWQINGKNIDLTGESIILSKNEQALVDLLTSEQMHLDDLADKMMLTISEVNQLIVQLELSGVIKSAGGGYYRKSK